MFVTIFKMKLDYEKEDEMIVIPQRLERQVKQEYALMGNKYVGFGDANGNCFMPERRSFTDNSIVLNTGKKNNSIMTDKLVAPYSTDGKSFSTTNTLWSSKGETTLCAQKNWAVANKTNNKQQTTSNQAIKQSSNQAIKQSNNEIHY